MKKIFFSLLAIAAVASCAKTESVYTEADAEIKLAPVAAKQTKANVLGAIDGVEYPTAENFDVYGYWKNVGAGEVYTDGVSYFGETGVEFVNKGNYWGGAKTYYWPKNGALRFAAYSPSSLDLAHKQVGDTFSVAGYEQPSSTAATWDFLVAPTSESYTAMTATENVAVKFEHALSWITLQVKAKDADAADVFTIKSVTINDVNTTADFEASMLGKEIVDYEAWSNQAAPAEYVVFEGEQGVTGEAAVIETTTAGTLVIPQETTNVTVVFNQKGVNGTLDMEDMVVNLDLVLDQDNEPWRPGYHYIYTLIFGLDEILINPSVDLWEEYIWAEGGSQGEIETDVNVTNVSTEAQLAAAVAEGGKIVLQNNIALETVTNLTVAAGNTVVLDLNGYTLSSESTNNSGNYEMFTVKGELTVKNGTVTTDHTGADLSWNSMTAIFDITGGGLVYLSDVKAENLGGTAMAFVAHLNNWGEATLAVDRSTLTSNYVAVRVFNSGNDMNNVSIYNSTLQGGSNAFWVHNYTAADFGSEAKAESQKALLNFDIYNGTNTFIGGKEFTPIRYGFSEAIYLDAEGNVPGNTVVVKSVAELQAALDAATAELTTIYLTADMAGDVTATQKAGVKVVINGNGKNYDGVLTVDGKSATYTTAGLTVKNLTFNATTISGDACIRLGDGTTATRYTCNVTVENCTFEVPGAVGVKSYTGGDKNLTISGCTATADAHSLLQIAGVDEVLVEKCIINSKNGMNFNQSDNITIDECEADVKGYAVRFGASSGSSSAAETYEIKNSTLKSACEDGDAVIILRGTADYSTLTLTNTTLVGTTEITNNAVDAQVIVK